MRETLPEKKKEVKPACAGCGKPDGIGANRPGWCHRCWPWPDQNVKK